MAGFSPLHVLLVDDSTHHGGEASFTGKLASGLSQRGYSVTVLGQKPIPRSIYPAYRIFDRIRRAFSPSDRYLPPAKGVSSLRTLGGLDSRIDLQFYSFSDDNLKVQALRKRIREISPDVCIPVFHDARQLVWAVTLLGSGIPYLYVEVLPYSGKDPTWSPERRLAAMSGADAIVLAHHDSLSALPAFLRDSAVPATEAQAAVEEDSLIFWEEALQKAASRKGQTVMDDFSIEPFASMARFFSVTQRDHIFRDFGQPMPGTFVSWLYWKFFFMRKYLFDREK